MTAPFDPYHKWLGIPPAQQPPTHYRLLGLEPFESDADVIDAAANQRMAYLQDLAVGERVAESQKLLNAVSTARRTLLNKERKAEYDIQLRALAAPAPAVASEPPLSADNPFATDTGADLGFAPDPPPSVRSRAKKIAAVAESSQVAPKSRGKLPLIAAAGVGGVLLLVLTAFFLGGSRKPAPDATAPAPDAAKPAAKGVLPPGYLPAAAHLAVEQPGARWQPSAPVQVTGKYHLVVLSPGAESTGAATYSSADGLAWQAGEKAALPGNLHHPALAVDAANAAGFGKDRLLLFATLAGGKPQAKLFHSPDGAAWTPAEVPSPDLPTGDEPPAVRAAWLPGQKQWLLTAGPPDGGSGETFPVFASADLKSWGKAGELKLEAFTGVPSLVPAAGEKPGDPAKWWAVAATGKAYPVSLDKGKIGADPKRVQFLDAGASGGRSDQGWQPSRLAATGPLLGGGADFLAGRDRGAVLALIPTPLREVGGKLARQLPDALRAKLDAAPSATHDGQGEFRPAAGKPADAFALRIEAELEEKGELTVELAKRRISFLAESNEMQLSGRYDGVFSPDPKRKLLRLTLVADGGWLLLLANDGRFSWSGPLPEAVRGTEPVVKASKAKSVGAKYLALP